MNPRLVRPLSLSGIVAAVFYFLHVYFGTRSYPNYSSMSQAVSDLTATDAPSFVVASRFSALYSMFSVLGCTSLCLIVVNQINKTFRLGIYLYAVMNWVSGIGYILFPLSSKGYQGTFQDVMHFYVITIVVVSLSLVSLTLIFVGGRKNKETKVIAILGFIVLLSMFLGSIGSGVAPKEYFGLFERFSVFSVVIYTALLSLFGYTYEGSRTSPA
ncbi:MAG: DUF998 domain-containing protein [Candidatus Caldatribacterium sp.]|nr:DUF998 domain-containing protein [Candidatus Caldatribacterium sp.]